MSRFSKEEMLKLVRERALATRNMYKEDLKNQSSNIIVYGDFGSGKTSSLATAVKPVHIDSFDPGGSKVDRLAKLIEDGSIIVDSQYEQDNWKVPYAYREYERQFKEKLDMGYFNFIGTYVVDSLTRFASSVMYEGLKIPHKTGQGAGRSRAGEIPELKDYLVQQFTLIDWLSKWASLPCNVVVTGHIDRVKDEVSGKIETGLLLPGKAATQVPIAFDEVWLTCVEKGEYMFRVKSDNYYRAESRMGGSVFRELEPQDYKRLFKMVGRPFEDMEAI